MFSFPSFLNGTTGRPRHDSNDLRWIADTSVDIVVFELTVYLYFAVLIKYKVNIKVTYLGAHFKSGQLFSKFCYFDTIFLR